MDSFFILISYHLLISFEILHVLRQVKLTNRVPTILLKVCTNEKNRIISDYKVLIIQAISYLPEHRQFIIKIIKTILILNNSKEKN